jgi:hypothetical protein
VRDGYVLNRWKTAAYFPLLLFQPRPMWLTVMQLTALPRFLRIAGQTVRSPLGKRLMRQSTPSAQTQSISALLKLTV